MNHSLPRSLFPPPSSQALREVRRNTKLRRARTCYGHLAGVAGVSLMDWLLDSHWIEPVPQRPDAVRTFYVPSAVGASMLERLGVVIPTPKTRKSVAFSCLDWTERRHHLGGALGRSIVDAMVDRGYVIKSPGSRVVELTAELDSILSFTPSRQ